MEYLSSNVKVFMLNKLFSLRQNTVKINPHINQKLSLILLIVGILTAGCSEQTNQVSSPKLQVVSTSTIISDLTEAIAQDSINQTIDHTSILKPGVDPHVYEPVPADSISLEKADLILYNGYNLEPGLIRIINATGLKSKKIAVAEKITPLYTEKEGKKYPDPHVWGNATNGIIMVNTIRDALIEISPAEREKFTANALELTQELTKVDQWIKSQINTIPANQRKLVTTHDAFQYYTSAYGLQMLGTLIGISTEEQPSAQTVKNLAQQIKTSQVPAIFAETTINPQLITTVAAEAGVKLAPTKLYSDSLGIPGSGADSYSQMLIANTRAIVEALGGKYTPFVNP
jgi:manganese/iron transport system substrate-binding protein